MYKYIHVFWPTILLWATSAIAVPAALNAVDTFAVSQFITAKSPQADSSSTVSSVPGASAGVSVVASTSVAPPSPATSGATGTAQASLTTISSPPADFGTEIVTATQNGTVFTFTHHIGINLGNDVDNNEIIDISAPLLEAVHNFVAGESICQDTAVTKRQAHNESMVSSLNIRADDPLISELVVDACFLPRMNAAFDQMDFDLTGALANVLPAVADSAAVIRDFAGAINVAFEMAYARLDGDMYYHWAPIEHRRLAVSVLGVLMILEAQNIHIQSRLILNNRLFRNDDDDTMVCGLNENAPACVETNCHGENGKCTTKGNEGCECYLIEDVAEMYPWDPDTMDEQQAMLAEAAIAVPGNPKCTGVGTQHTVSRQSGVNAINQFCGSGNIIKDPSPIVTDYTQQYFNGTDSWVQLRIDFGQLGSGMPSDDCKNFLLTILDGCDGNNPDNPGDWKHGGTIDYQGGLSLELTPLAGNPIHCNNYPFQKWIDINIGVNAINQFCLDQQSSFSGPPGLRIESEYNQGTSTDVMITLSYYEQYEMSMSDCISQFRNTLDNCDHNDPTNNPYDNKYGGTYTNGQGAVFMVTPMAKNITGFPPSNEAVVPSCGTDGKVVDPDDLSAAYNKFCQDAIPLYSAKYNQGKDQLTLSAVLTPDPGSIWPNGSTACRGSSSWDGTMHKGDCLYAFGKTSKKCPQSVNYDYHCVTWSATAIRR